MRPIWSFDGMRIPADLLECILYAYKDEPSAEAGENLGATAFFANAELTHGRVAPFIVTNRHVIEDSFTTFRYAKGSGFAVLATDEREWFFHPDPNVDLAVFLLLNNRECEGSIFIPTQLFLSREGMPALDVVWGDDVFMVGRHIHYDGRETVMPTARLGHIAQLPGEPVLDERGRKQEAFLIQIPSLPGFSGSPVFLAQNLSEMGMAPSIEMINSGVGNRRVKLLGVNCGHLPSYSPIYMAHSKERNEHLTAETGSGVTSVAPAWRLAETISACLSARASGR